MTESTAPAAKPPSLSLVEIEARITRLEKAVATLAQTVLGSDHPVAAGLSPTSVSGPAPSAQGADEPAKASPPAASSSAPPSPSPPA